MSQSNTWPRGHPHVMHQHEHEKWNLDNYPGTKQLCANCDEPTERCEEDSIYAFADVELENPLCVYCATGGD